MVEPILHLSLLGLSLPPPRISISLLPSSFRFTSSFKKISLNLFSLLLFSFRLGILRCLASFRRLIRWNGYPRLLVSLSHANGGEKLAEETRPIISLTSLRLFILFFSLRDPYVFSAINVYVPKAFVTIALRMFDDGSPSILQSPLFSSHWYLSCFLLFSNL